MSNRPNLPAPSSSKAQANSQAEQLTDLKRQISSLKSTLDAATSAPNRLVTSASVSANLQQQQQSSAAAAQQHKAATLGDFLEPIVETKEESSSASSALALAKTSKSFSNTSDLNRYLQQSDFATGYDDQNKLTLEVSAEFSVPRPKNSRIEQA